MLLEGEMKFELWGNQFDLDIITIIGWGVLAIIQLRILFKQGELSNQLEKYKISVPRELQQYDLVMEWISEGYSIFIGMIVANETLVEHRIAERDKKIIEGDEKRIETLRRELDDNYAERLVLYSVYAQRWDEMFGEKEHEDMLTIMMGKFLQVITAMKRWDWRNVREMNKEELLEEKIKLDGKMEEALALWTKLRRTMIELPEELMSK